MQKKATITSKGQITVPLEVRRMLGVRSGDKLLFEIVASVTPKFRLAEKALESGCEG